MDHTITETERVEFQFICAECEAISTGVLWTEDDDAAPFYRIVGHTDFLINRLHVPTALTCRRCEDKNLMRLAEKIDLTTGEPK